MMTIRIRVTRVDMNGYNGRDHETAPTTADEGCEGTITNIDLEPATGYEPTEPDEIPCEMYRFTDGRHGPQVFYAVLDSGRCVQLMGHEFDLLSCTHDGDL